MSVTKFYPAAGNGTVQSKPYPGSWATQRAAATGAVAYKGDSSNPVEFGLGSYLWQTGYLYIQRGFFPFDTSTLPDADIISAASLNIYCSYVVNDFPTDPAEWIGVTESTQASTSDLTTADFDCVSFTDGGHAATSGFAESQYNSISLNATGIGWISKTGYSKLAGIFGQDSTNNTDYIQWNGNSWKRNAAYFYTVAYSGTSRDPYLEVVSSPAVSNSRVASANRVANTGRVAKTGSVATTGRVAASF